MAIFVLLFLFFLTLSTYLKDFKKLRRKYKIGYNHQSVQSVAGKLSCRRTALKRCTKIEILWYSSLSLEPHPSWRPRSLPNWLRC